MELVEKNGFSYDYVLEDTGIIGIHKVYVLLVSTKA